MGVLASCLTYFLLHLYIQGGSLGKGTAIKDDADIDLVIVLNEVESAEDLKDKLPGIKSDIKEEHLLNPFFPCKIQGAVQETKFALKFKIDDGDNCIDVDLLPTFAIGGKLYL